MQKEIKVILCAPGKSPKPATIKNTLEELQKIVGGYIETHTFAEDACIICNEEGRLLGLAPCMTFRGTEFVGTCIIAGVDGDVFCDLPIKHLDILFADIDKGGVQDGTVLDLP